MRSLSSFGVPAAIVVAVAVLLAQQPTASSSSRPGPTSAPVLRSADGLEAGLAAALRRATADAAAGGLELRVNSGRRTAQEQARLLEEAVDRYGSREEAARWVASPERSAHVSGDAVDIGPPTAAAWLAEHGARYGLCRTYGNEPWHFELRPAAVGNGCPPPYADPTQDPRLRP